MNRQGIPAIPVKIIVGNRNCCCKQDLPCIRNEGVVGAGCSCSLREKQENGFAEGKNKAAGASQCPIAPRQGGQGRFGGQGQPGVLDSSGKEG